MKFLFQKNLLWSIGIYEFSNTSNLPTSLLNPIKVIDTKKIRTSKQHIHTAADPFLLVHDNELYVFYESQYVSQNGKIECVKTRDLKKWIRLGVVLEKPYHLSYPFVFKHNDTIYLIPESKYNGTVDLFKFEEFPYKLQKVKTLLYGNYVDSSCIVFDDIFYLFTSQENKFEIYYTNQIGLGKLKPHPKNPISLNPQWNRCGGSPYVFDSGMYRFAQDCSDGYGNNINVMRINKLSPYDYEETLYRKHFFDKNESWNELGGHHIHFTTFNKKLIVATDGKQHDFMINKFLSPFFKLF